MAGAPPPPPTQLNLSHRPRKKKRTWLYVAIVVIVLIVVIIDLVNTAEYVAATSKATVTYSTTTAESIGVSTPSQGNEYLIANMSIQDYGCKSLFLDPIDVQVTTNSVTYNIDEATFSLSNPLPSVTLQPGGMTAGAVAFQVPIGAPGFSFGFSYIGAGPCTVSWVSA